MSTYSLTLRQNLSRPMTCQEMDDNLLYLEDIAKRIRERLLEKNGEYFKKCKKKFLYHLLQPV